MHTLSARRVTTIEASQQGVGAHLVYENQLASIELSSYQNPPGSPQERVALAPLYALSLRVCFIRSSSRHTVESLTDMPVSASSFRYQAQLRTILRPNSFGRPAYYLVRLGTYSAKWAARAAKGEVGKQLSLGGAVAMETAKNFVGGSLDDARVREEIDVPDPATGELLVRVPVSGPEDVDRAVRAAQEAYQEWSLEPVTRRARRMFRLQVLLEERIDELAEIATRGNGKHVEESTAEIRHRGRRARGLDDHADEGRDPRPGKCWGGRRPVRGVSGGPDGVEFYTERKVVIERWQ